jgi:hypothetical protein
MDVNSTDTARRTNAAAPSPWRSPGIWMSFALSAFLLSNVVRALLNPADFAANFGAPLTNSSDTAFVIVYAIRTLFIALFGLVLIARAQWRVLPLFALVAVIMPIGDALLVVSQGGAAAIIARHVVTAVAVLVTWFFLRRWVRRLDAAV